MDHERQQIEQTTYFTGLEQDFSMDPNFYDVKDGHNSFLSEQNSNYGTNFASSSDFDPNMGLQVVPSFDHEVFADSFFSRIDYENNGIHQNQSGTNYLPEENLGKLCESLSCLPEQEVDKDERTDSNSEIKRRDIATSPKRRQSDTDSLDVYLKPCVITPTKVEDLYSTLEDEDTTIFQFPPDKAAPTYFESMRGSQENQGLNDSNVYEIQLCSLSHHKALNIESSNDRNLNPYHGNDLFEKKSCCCSTNTQRLNHRLASRHLEQEPPILTNNYSPCNIQSVSSNTEEFQKSSSNSFPPFLLELSTSQRIFAPKPARGKPDNICQNVSNERISLNFDKKEHLHMENKGTSSDKGDRKGSLLRETTNEETQGKNTEINVFQKNNKTTLVQDQIQPTVTINDEKQAETRIFDNQKFKRLSKYSKTFKKESCANTTLFKRNYSDSDVEMSTEAEKTSRDTRMNHNDTEKQRRDQMKGRFESLRHVIPRIESLEKTPKVQILKQAWKYVRFLEEEGETLEKIKGTEKEKNQKLLKKLQNIVKILKESSQP